ncbi:MAG: non-canonical purine NTP pyrophosphatase [Gemmatimonadota bacterium]
MNRGRCRILVATRSVPKLAELRTLLGDLPVDVVSLADLELEPTAAEEELERFETFAENAAAKARYFHRLTGLPAIADDSGLCVDALGGEPGVRTKRFAPEELAARWGRDAANNRYLLERLGRVPEEERGAEYRCALAGVARGDPFMVEGRVRGRITAEPRGKGGFGYDPLFYYPPAGGTFAELPPAVKREHSHRAEAIRGLRPWVEALVEGGG